MTTRYNEPVTRKYYDILTNGTKSQKLSEIENFNRVYRHIMDDIVPRTNRHGGTVRATLMNCVIGEDGNGYGTLNVLAYLDGESIPFDCFTDIARIEDGELRTWFPYPAIAYYKKGGEVGIERLATMKDYTMKDRALGFIRKTSVNNTLHQSISKSIMNGYYHSTSLKMGIKERAYIVEAEEEQMQEKNREAMTYTNMLDEWGMEATEIMEDVDKIYKSEVPSLFNTMPDLGFPKIDADIEVPRIEMETDIPFDEEIIVVDSNEDILEGEFLEIDPSA